MSEQAPNSQTTEQKLFSMFGGDDDAPKGPEKASEALSVTPDTEVPAEDETLGAELEGQEPTPQEPEVAEVEIDGEVYQVPVKIKDRFIHHADYTRKTQDLAELRRSVTAQQEAANIGAAFEREVNAERGQLAIMDAQLAQFKQLDWSSMQAEDMLRARAHQDRLKDDRAEVEKSIEAKRKVFGDKVQSARAQALQAGSNYIRQHIKGFDDKLQKQMMDYGVTEGYRPEELSQIIDPRIVVTMFKAMKWDELQRSAPGVTNKASRAAPAIRPGASTKQPSQSQILRKRQAEAKTPGEKRAVVEDRLAHMLGGGR